MAAGSYSQVGFVAVIAFFVLFVIQKLLKRNSSSPRLPPGPMPLPIIGNLLGLPPKGIPEYRHWLKHKDTYGPISSVTVMGQSLIIFHDKNAAYAVLGKKAQKTSARPQMTFAKLCGFENFLITHQYDDKYRRHRKMVQQEIGTKGRSAGFQPIQEREALHFTLQSFRDPDNMMVYLKTWVALSLTFQAFREADASPLSPVSQPLLFCRSHTAIR
jgi:hypothetical protein